MNKSLTMMLLKDQVKKMMRRIEKCDRRLAANILGVVGKESEEERKQRLLGLVSERLRQITELEKEIPTQ